MIPYVPSRVYDLQTCYPLSIHADEHSEETAFARTGSTDFAAATGGGIASAGTVEGVRFAGRGAEVD